MIDTFDIAYRIKFLVPDAQFSVKEKITYDEAVMYRNQHENIYDYSGYYVIWPEGNSSKCPSKEGIESISKETIAEYRNELEILQFIDSAKNDFSIVALYYNAKLINNNLLFDDYVRKVYCLRQRILNESA